MNPLLESARRAIAQRREYKSMCMAHAAWSCRSGPITAELLELAGDHEWQQLAEAAAQAINEAHGLTGSDREHFGTPSEATKQMTLEKLRLMEQKRTAVA